jgi:hypothetical protein
MTTIILEKSILPSSIKNIHFEFENIPTRIIATRNIPELETPGILIKETKAGTELTISLWIAWILLEAGLVRLMDEGISNEEWTQIHYRERFQPATKLSPLPRSFYPRAYLTLSNKLKTALGDITRLESLNRLKGRFRDIIESRMGKIVRLATLEVTAESRALQPEELYLYKKLRTIISEWRREIRMEEEI